MTKTKTQVLLCGMPVGVVSIQTLIDEGQENPQPYPCSGCKQKVWRSDKKKAMMKKDKTAKILCRECMKAYLERNIKPGDEWVHQNLTKN